MQAATGGGSCAGRAIFSNAQERERQRGSTRQRQQAGREARRSRVGDWDEVGGHLDGAEQGC